MTPAETLESLTANAKLHRVNPAVVLAIASVESGVNPNAIRYEPAYIYLVAPKDYARSLGITAETETALQKFSYGALQIMGACVRGQGFLAPLTELVSNPELAIEAGIKHLLSLYKSTGSDGSTWNTDVIAAYNAGSARRTASGAYANQEYVNRVTAALRLYA